MKHAKSIGVLVLLLLTMAVPSKSMAQSWWEGFANAPQSNAFLAWLQQYPGLAAPLQQNPYQVYDPSWRARYPQFMQYINNNPGWWNGILSAAPQYYDGPFANFLSEHPRIANELRQNPGLIYDSSYLAARPALKQFLKKHPRIWRDISNKNYGYSNYGGWGAYNNYGQWSDQNWWRNNGDWDDENQWHDRSWWQKNKRQQAQQRHPEWFSRSETGEASGEAQHRRQHGSTEPGRPGGPPASYHN